MKNKQNTNSKYRKSVIKSMEMMSRFIRTSLLAIILVAALASFGIIYAEEGPSAEETANTEAAANTTMGAFKVTNYVMHAKVAKDHSCELEEQVTVDIPEQLQSIEFAIPSGNFRVSGLEVENTAYSANKASEASTITIVDPEKLSEGSHTYTIKYTIKEFEDRDSAKDMFYLNVLLPEWKQPIANVNIRVEFPEDFPWDDMQCYAGQFGVEDTNHTVEYEDDEEAKVVTIRGEKIPENYAITVKAELPEGYWKGALNGSWVIPAILGTMLSVLLLLTLLWFIGGRDPKVEKTVETKPIEGILPVEIGYIFNSEVRIRDILLLLMYFGRKGYLSISEYEPKRYRIFRKKSPKKEEKLYRNAYSILFEDVYKNRAVEMEDLGERLMRIRDAIKDDVAAGHSAPASLAFTPMSRIFRYIGGGLLAAGLAVSNALSYRFEYLPISYVENILVFLVFAAALHILCKATDEREASSYEGNRSVEIMSAAAAGITVIYVATQIFRRTGSIAAALAIIALSGAGIFLILIMRARGKDNAVLVSRLRSLRNFIYHPTPKELLENHLADENYYYDMLQYALASGAEESWAISFLTLDVPEPDWYSHDVEGHTFSNLREEMTTVDYARDLKAFMRTIEAAFAELMRRRRRR